MTIFTAAIEQASDILWNSLLLFLLVGTGVFFTIRLRGVQLRRFGEGFHRVFGNFTLRGKKADDQGMSSFQALATAIAAQVGTGDFTLEGMGAPLIPAVNETTSLSFPSYVRTVRRMCRRLEHGTERSSLLLGKMPFQSRHYPLYCNQSNLAAKEMWSRMWLNRKGDSV